MARLTCLAVVLISLAQTSIALGQGREPTAGQRAAGESLLQAGKAAYDAGNYPQALRDFEQALARLGRPTIHYDIGQAAARAGEDARALAAFRDYLSALPNAPNRPEVERRIQLHEQAIVNSASLRRDLSPSAAAHAEPAQPDATVNDSGAVATTSHKRDAGELWWLWAGIGAVVVGTVVAALVVNVSDDPVQPPMRGLGGTIQTLEVR